MKNLFKHRFVLLALVTAFTLVGCKKKEEPKPKPKPVVKPFTAAKPTITISGTVKGKKFSSGDSVARKDTVKLTAVVKIPGIFSSLEIFKGTKSLKKFDKKSLKLKNGTKEVKGLAYEYPVAETDEKTVSLKFIATDSIKQKTVTEFKMKVKVPKQNPATKAVYTIYPPNKNDSTSTSKSIVTLLDKKVYSISEIEVKGNQSSPESAYLDFGYFYNETKGASFISISKYEAETSIKLPKRWLGKNDCKFSAVVSDITAEQFDKMKEGKEVKEALKNKAITTSSITKLKKGDIFAFASSYASKEKGFIKIVDFKEGSKKDGGFIKISFVSDYEASGGVDDGGLGDIK